MTRCSPRRYISRPPYSYCPKRPTIRNDSFYYLRNFLLRRLLLSFLSFKPSTNPWTRWMLATYRYHPFKPLRSTTTQHLSLTSLWSLYYLSPSQPYRRRPQTYNPSPIYYNPPRFVFYHFTNLRILRSPIHNFWWDLRLYILYSYRIPRPSRHHRIYLSHRMLPTTTKLSLHIWPPLWIRSCCLILTLRRCSMTIPICIHLLMRILFL